MQRKSRTYRYFIKTSSASTPPSEAYILLSTGDISDCLIDWRISTTVARWTSYPFDLSASMSRYDSKSLFLDPAFPAGILVCTDTVDAPKKP